MDYMPPGRVVKVGDRRWRRYRITDGCGQYWAGDDRWIDKPAEAVLFCRQTDALAVCNRHCLGGYAADTYQVSVVLTVTAGRWTRKELLRRLERHRLFCASGPPGKDGLLLEMLPKTLRKVKP
jgi:hypothetical protein